MATQRMFDAKFYCETYSIENVSDLCRIAGFEATEPQQIIGELEDIAALYRWEDAKHSGRPRSSDVQRDLEGLMKRVKRLNEGLDKLPEEAAYRLRVAIDSNNSIDFATSLTTKSINQVGSLIMSLPEDAEPILGTLLEVSEIRFFLGGLERAIETAVERLPKRVGGKVRDHGLRLWMINMKSFWERNTTQPFTRDETDTGDPITPAARFCVAAFRHISPDYPQSRVLWEMRQCIADARTST